MSVLYSSMFLFPVRVRRQSIQTKIILIYKTIEALWQIVKRSCHFNPQYTIRCSTYLYTIYIYILTYYVPKRIIFRLMYLKYYR